MYLLFIIPSRHHYPITSTLAPISRFNHHQGLLLNGGGGYVSNVRNLGEEFTGEGVMCLRSCVRCPPCESDQFVDQKI